MAFGSICALITSAIAVQFISFAPRGTEFGSLNELRNVMDSEAPLPPPDGSTSGGEQVSLRGIVQSHPDDRIIYTLRPNLDLTFMRAHVQTNSCGMRSPERPIVKPPGTYRIALLGDSFAFGWGVEQHQSFAQVLEDTLNRAAHGSIKFEVLNFGVPGYSTFQEVALFEELGLSFNPDAVLVYFVQNDFGMPFFVRDLSGDSGILSSVKFVDLGKRFFQPDEMNQKINSLGLDPNQALNRLSSVLQERGIRGYVTINPRKSWRKDLARLNSVRKSPSISFIPLREGLLEYISRHNIQERDLTLSFDPHPSPIRHTILGELLAAAVLSDLPQLPAPAM